jgi:ABC-type branched-subunit amino acid transport system substrate-binding protein
MKTLLTRLACALALGLATSAACAQPVPGVTSSSILLGESAAFTGPAQQLGIQMRDGMMLWFNHVNAQGGVHGRTIRLVTRDDGYESDRAAENTRKLIEADRVFALVGYVGTPTSKASLPVFTKAKVPFVGPFTGAELLRTPLNPYVFNVRASYYNETDAIVEQLLTTGSKRFAVFYQNDSYGLAGLTGVQIAVRKRGGEIVATGTVERNTVDVAKAIKAILPKRPDAVIMISAYKSIAAFIKTAKKDGYDGQFYNVSFVGSTALANELGNEGVGVAISQVVPFPWSLSVPVVEEFNNLAKKAKVDVNFSSLEGFLVAKVSVEGLRRAGRNLTRERFMNALESMHDVDFGGFAVSYSPTNHNGSMYVDLTIIGRDGGFKD